jgi:hypothetical protein
MYEQALVLQELICISIRAAQAAHSRKARLGITEPVDLLRSSRANVRELGDSNMYESSANMGWVK